VLTETKRFCIVVIKLRNETFPYGEVNSMERKILIDCRGNVSRQKVAAALNITPQMLGAIERGDRTPSLLLAKKISDFYGKPIEYLFFNQFRHKTFPLVDKQII
jgi:putative transcriptional regulator